MSCWNRIAHLHYIKDKEKYMLAQVIESVRDFLILVRKKEGGLEKVIYSKDNCTLENAKFFAELKLKDNGFKDIQFDFL